MLNPGGFFLCYFKDMEERAHEIAIAVDAWIREIDAIEDVEIDYIVASFEALRAEFDIPEELAKNAVARALGEG
jgi:hypothetical protein